MVNKRALLGIALSLVLGLAAYVLSNNIAFGVLILVYFAVIAIIASRGYRKNIIMLAFLMCFFVFLMGRPIVYEIFHLSNSNAINLSVETRCFTYVCLSISLLALALGYTLAAKIKKGKNDADSKVGTDSGFTDSLQSITKKTTIFLYLFVILENLLRCVFVKDIGYTASFIAGNNYTLPYGLHVLVSVAPVSLCLFLATLPGKKDSRVPLLLFLVASVIPAFAGSRFEIISCILLVTIYLVLRTKDGGEVWIKKKHIVAMLILTPVIVLLLQNMTYWRDGKENDIDRRPIADFMMGVGGSSDLIGMTKEYGDSALSQNIVYSFGGLWRRIRGNTIAEFAGGSGVYGHQTVEYARNGHSLSSALTYYFFPERYQKGFGLGGCYIAELYHDFSIIGVIIGNLTIGFIIGRNRRLSDGKVFRNFFCLFLFILLIRMPRDSFDYLVVELTGLKNIIFAVIIVAMAKYRSLRSPNKQVLLQEKQ